MQNTRKTRRSARKRKFITAFFLIAAGILFFSYLTRIDENKYDALIDQAARKYNVDARLVKAVIYQESRFDARARGGNGEIGLMQVMPRGSAADWARHHKVGMLSEGLLFNPELNIEIGTWYLAEALKRWRNYRCGEELALCQYNAGSKRAEAWKPESYDGTVIGRIKIKSTRAYVKAIMRKYRKYCDK
ncbi:MAG: lytic transglycosylase domain-containing protein [Victivallaceae bacterium]|nr:lytic transglycosylase domain-containing protein [Victivallaceae bacterium]